MSRLRFALLLPLMLLTVTPNHAAETSLVLAVAGRSNAHSSIAASGSFAAVAWSASTADGITDIYVAVSRDGAATFSAPVRVNSTPGDARLNGEQPPRITLAKGSSATPVISVVWTSKSEKGTILLSARSTDGGRSFARSTLVPGGEAAGNRGWQNAASDADGKTRVVWLDHRELAASSGGAGGASGHNHAGHDATPAAKMDGVAMAQQSKLYLATLGEPASVTAITGGVCYCCKTAIVTGANGLVALAWRHVYPGNFRDIAYTLSRDGGRTFSPPRRVSQDQWQIEGCPDDGPAMAMEASGQTHIAWPTLVTDGPGGQPSIGIFYASQGSDGAFGARQRLRTEGLPHHPQVAVANDIVFVAWDELQQGKRRVVVAQRPRSAGATQPFVRSVVNGEEPGLYPAVAAVPAGLAVSWSSGSGANAVIRVARVQTSTGTR